MSAPAVEARAEAGAVRRTPYQGLVPYSEADADWFFGRHEWCDVVGDNLRAYRITVLYGSSGVGKSSLLRAGLGRRLADEARSNVADFGAPRLLPVVFSAWSLDDPLTALKQAVADAAREIAPELAGEQPEGSLADVLEAWPARIEGPLLLVLDQFEEFFLYHDLPGDSRVEEVGAALRRRVPGVHYLLSIREDSLARLDRFKGHVPGLLDHLLRIDHLDREAACEAIVLPLERWSQLAAAPDEQVEAEPALVETVLDQVTAGQVSLAEAGAHAVAPARSARKGIVAPYLQLVLERLWDEERRHWDGQGEGEPRLLRLQTLVQLGGAERIVRTHLDAALAALPAHEQDVAGKVFRHLVTPSGTKIALRVSDLAEYTHLPEERIEPLVEQLTGDVRILRGAGEGRYEIYHDALAGPILDWSARWQERQRRRREWRRLAALGAVAVALAGIAALIAVFAIQARHAQQRAENALRAQSQALAVQSVASLDADPLAGLQLAIQAEEVASTIEAEGALRAALAAALHLKSPPGDTGSVNSANFSPDGKLVITTSDNGTARVWGVASGRSLVTLKGHTGPVYSAAFSPDGRFVVTASEDGTARIWDVASGRNLHVLVGSAGRIVSAAVSPDGKLIVTASEDGTARIWDVARGRALRLLRGHTGPVYSAAFSRDGRLVVTASEDGTARVWDVASGRNLHHLATTGRIVSAAVGPDGRFVVTASEDGKTRVWGVASGRVLRLFRGHTGPVYSAAFSRDGRLVVTASEDGTARVWDVYSGRNLRTFRGHIGGVAVFSPDGERVVTAGAGGAARIWDVASGRSLQTLTRDTGNGRSAAFSPNGTLVVIAGGDGTARVWDVASGRSLHTLTTNAATLAVSSDGKLVLTAGDDGTAGILNVADGRRVDEFSGIGVARSAAFSRDSKLVVVASADGRARILNRDRQFIIRLKPPAGPVHWTGFSQNGKRVVTASDDGTASIWDTTSGQRRQILRGDIGPTKGAAFSRDGKLIVTARADGTVHIWSCDVCGVSVAKLLASAKARLPASR